MRGHIDTIERVTGHRPPMCPWRAFSLPIVREVLDVSWACADGGGALPAVIGTDPPHRLAAAIGVYRRALNATNADEHRLKRAEEDAKRRVREAMRKGRNG